MAAPQPDPPPRRRASADIADRIMAISAMIAAVAAVVVALYEVRVSRTYQELSVWPYLQHYTSNAERSYSRYVHNFGTGPALIRAVEVLVDSVPRESWPDAIEAVLGRTAPMVLTSLGTGAVLVPNQPIRMLRVPLDEGGEALRVAGTQARLVTRICYCSLYEKCWWLDEREPEPQPVGRCELPPERQFR